MSGRASIKGQGASIFFEDGEEPHPNKQPGEQPAQEVARADDGAAAPRHHGTNEPTNAPVSAPSSERSGAGAFFGSLVLPPELRRRLRSVSRGEHPFHTSVRLSREEMDAIRDILYELEAKMGIAATGNDVMRIGLQLLLEDYAQRKKQSLLVQVLGEEEDEY